MKKVQYAVLLALVAVVLASVVIPHTAVAAPPSSSPQYLTAHLSCNGAGGGCTVADSAQFPIPAGKRVFIQFASAVATIEGATPQQAVIRLTVPAGAVNSGCSLYEYALPVTSEGVVGSGSQFSSSQQMLLIAEPLAQPCIPSQGIGAYIYSTTTSAITVLNVHISGYIQ